MAKAIDIMEEVAGAELKNGETFIAAAAVDRSTDTALPGTAEFEAQKAVNEALEALGISSSMIWGLSATRLVIVKVSGLGGKTREVAANHYLAEVAAPEATNKGAGLGKLGMTVKISSVPLRVVGKKKDVDDFLFKLQGILAKNRGKW